MIKRLVGSNAGESAGADPTDAGDSIAPVDARRSRFIRRNLTLSPVPGLGDIRLHLAHPGSGLGRLLRGAPGQPPYWAYCWAGGLALAHHFAAHPEKVRNRRVLDIGAGGGIVAIAAAKAGARDVLAAETDPYGRAAIALNAAANDARITILAGDIVDRPLPNVDLVAAGDVFYDEAVASAVLPFLDRCLAAGIEVLVGDPGRKPLPLSRLRHVADYPVTDFGNSKETGGKSGRGIE